MHCNHCGGSMRRFQSDEPSCILCGRENKPHLACPLCGSEPRLVTKTVFKTAHGTNKGGYREYECFDIECVKPDCFLTKENNNYFNSELLAWDKWETRHEQL